MQAETTLPPHEAFNAMHHMLAGSGIQITNATPPTLQGYVVEARRPSVIAAIILFFLCIIPGIIYLISASKDRTWVVSVQVQPSAVGSFLMVNGQGSAYYAACSAVQKLPRPIQP